MNNDTNTRLAAIGFYIATGVASLHAADGQILECVCWLAISIVALLDYLSCLRTRIKQINESDKDSKGGKQ